MTTPPPDKQPAPETPEEIAQRIADNYVPYRSDWRDRKLMESDILEALRNERERAVRIINEHQALDKCEDNCWTTIKKVIREGK